MTIALLMINTYFNNIIINLAGLLIVSFIIYKASISKNDVFGFLILLYFCSHFPYLLAKGGAFSLVAFTIALIIFFRNPKKFRLLY